MGEWEIVWLGVCASVTFSVIVLDVVARIFGGSVATLSWKMHLWSLRYPVVALVWGILSGHFFWGQGC